MLQLLEVDVRPISYTVQLVVSGINDPQFFHDLPLALFHEFHYAAFIRILILFGVLFTSQILPSCCKHAAIDCLLCLEASLLLFHRSFSIISNELNRPFVFSSSWLCISRTENADAIKTYT